VSDQGSLQPRLKSTMCVPDRSSRRIGAFCVWKEMSYWQEVGGGMKGGQGV
jgi:hypothetical protein